MVALVVAMRVGGLSKDGETVTYMPGIMKTPDIVPYCCPSTKDSAMLINVRISSVIYRELYITFATISTDNFGVNSYCHPFRFAHYLLPRKPRACDRR